MADREYEHLDPLLAEFAALPPGDERRRRLRDELVAEFMPVVEHVARRYAGRGEPFDDLQQVGSVGLLGALERYEPDRGRDFLSFALPTIMGEIRRYFRDSAWSVKTPRSVKDRFLAVNAAIARISQRQGRAPTVTELSEDLGTSRENVLEAIAARSSYQSGSLDEAVHDDDDSGLVEFLGVTDTDLEQVEVRSVVGDLVASLPRRERTMIILRFVHEKTQSEIAAELGVSQMHVSRLLTRTLAQLRDRAESPTSAAVGASGTRSPLSDTA